MAKGNIGTVTVTKILDVLAHTSAAYDTPQLLLRRTLTVIYPLGASSRRKSILHILLYVDASRLDMEEPSLTGLNININSSDQLSFLTDFQASVPILPQFVTLLAASGIRGPYHVFGTCLDQRGKIIGRGSQFTVFEDKFSALDNTRIVFKRVNANIIAQPLTTPEIDHRRNSHLHTMRLELLALSHPSVQAHANIIEVLFWGLDYPTSDRKMALPFLVMEKALCSLRDLLERPQDYGVDQVSFTVRYLLCLDILEGLACLHQAKIVHGDIKPANILVFANNDPLVPFVAKLNDLGMCIHLQEDELKSYESYRGTPGWRAPELEPTLRENGCFRNDLLYKCDVFAFGLLVSSVLFCSGEKPFEQDQLSRDGLVKKALGLSKGQLSESNVVPRLISRLEKLISASLDADPGKRPILHRDLLAIDSPEYNVWYEKSYAALELINHC